MGEQIQSGGCWSALPNSNQSTKAPTETHKSSNADSAGRRENRMSNGCRPHVHFKDSVIVILIPCRLEYFSAGLTPILWWMKSDFILFRKSAFRRGVDDQNRLACKIGQWLFAAVGFFYGEIVDVHGCSS